MKCSYFSSSPTLKHVDLFTHPAQKFRFKRENILYVWHWISIITSCVCVCVCCSCLTRQPVGQFPRLEQNDLPEIQESQRRVSWPPAEDFTPGAAARCEYRLRPFTLTNIHSAAGFRKTSLSVSITWSTSCRGVFRKTLSKSSVTVKRPLSPHSAFYTSFHVWELIAQSAQCSLSLSVCECWTAFNSM